MPASISNSAIKNPHISKLAILKGKPNEEDAFKILADLAHRVSYLMKENKLKAISLVEFYPKDKRLLGMNVNRGLKIMLRLRHPHDEFQFLSRESIMGTLLHELTHNLFGPHDNKFYSKLDELTGRQWVIEQRGLVDVFLGSGKRLGGQNLSERRLVNKARITKLSGIKLGGNGVIKPRLSPREMAAKAAARRAEDSRWCGASFNSKIRSTEAQYDELQVIVIEEDGIADQNVNGEPEIIDLT